MNKINLHLVGDLGNQMFQLALGISLQKKYNLDFRIDKLFVYKNKYALTYKLDLFKNSQKIKKTRKIDQILYLIDRFFFIFFGKKLSKSRIVLSDYDLIINHKFNICKVNWINRFFLSKDYKIPKNINKQFSIVKKFDLISNYDHKFNNYKVNWINGYYQSEDYFKNYKQDIFDMFYIDVPNDNKFKKLNDKIKSTNSVAIGIRQFEEMGEDRKLVGGITNENYYNESIEIMNSKIKNPHFFVFSKKNFPIIKKINFDLNVTFINDDTGYKGTIENLWLMSHCHNHIIGNSTFHWWGAWLAEYRYKKSIIISSDNFPSKNTIPDRWLKIKI